MANSTIYFFPTRNFISPAPPVDVYYELQVDLSAFNPSLDVGQKTIKTVSGDESSSLFYITDQWTCTVLAGSVTTDEMKTFTRSTINRERFQMTNPDEGNRLMDVQVTSRPTRSRENPSILGQFDWTFTVREVIN